MTNQEIMFSNSPTTYRVFIDDKKPELSHNDIMENIAFLRYELDTKDIMLDTGLRDKDDTPIYERDALRLDNGHEGEVIFARGAFYFRSFDNESEPVLLSEVNDTATVIDCVYLNPSLTGLF